MLFLTWQVAKDERSETEPDTESEDDNISAGMNGKQNGKQRVRGPCTNGEVIKVQLLNGNNNVSKEKKAKWDSGHSD